jgi:hypothetical protein
MNLSLEWLCYRGRGEKAKMIEIELDRMSKIFTGFTNFSDQLFENPEMNLVHPV